MKLISVGNLNRKTQLVKLLLFLDHLRQKKRIDEIPQVLAKHKNAVE